ncbi:Tetratricopeptide TPR_1 repeat-containing protein [Pseudodesulfovibrio mercurii]|uniref:Tetratricopeptide TPR_1 repeat-containing protein n=1 Tax=Pseudodesulfovibrio mercurii TaxID=641491 RepID=F0JJ16_9BACT|nr:tetratricopeptide repeat protein [Pseudodesulfovibrio mercurii]EGB15915.1 Tetratricopeptide TPR_1 repeat-containing protein [Pseudodesulfovibrio mercurii]
MNPDEPLTLGRPGKAKPHATGAPRRAAVPADVRVARISGAFSSQVVALVGTGTTRRKVVQKAFWFAEEAEPGPDGARTVLVQPLNNQNVPSGDKQPVPLPDFLHDYSPELEYYQAEVYPRMRELKETLTRAEKQRGQGALYSAQFEYESALGLDEQNVRANFGLGLTYLARGDTDKAGDIFKRLVALDAAFAPEHKHLFNEFGISLRKSGLTDQAVAYYARALEITEEDENLFYNIARAHFERGDEARCRENLGRALELAPHMEVALRFLEFLDKKAG